MKENYEGENQNSHYVRDLEFYTGLQHQVRRPDTPEVLKKVLVSYQNHMTRTYDLSLEDLESQSAVLHYKKEFEGLEKKVIKNERD